MAALAAVGPRPWSGACRRRGEEPGPSLASRSDFRLAQESRAGSLLFSYLDRDAVLRYALDAAEPTERIDTAPPENAPTSKP